MGPKYDKPSSHWTSFPVPIHLCPWRSRDQDRYAIYRVVSLSRTAKIASDIRRNPLSVADYYTGSTAVATLNLESDGVRLSSRAPGGDGRRTWKLRLGTWSFSAYFVECEMHRKIDDRSKFIGKANITFKIIEWMQNLWLDNVVFHIDTDLISSIFRTHYLFSLLNFSPNEFHCFKLQLWLLRHILTFYSIMSIFIYPHLYLRPFLLYLLFYILSRQ